MLYPTLESVICIETGGSSSPEPVSRLLVRAYTTAVMRQQARAHAADVRRETGDMDSAMRKPCIRATRSFSSAFGPSSLPGAELQALHVTGVPANSCWIIFLSFALG